MLDSANPTQSAESGAATGARTSHKEQRKHVRSLGRHQNRRADGYEPFLSIPLDVYRSTEFRRLSAPARALLLEFASRYNGYNNGELEMTEAQYRTAGLGSPMTMRRYLRELLEGGWIVVTRYGGMRRGPNVYALTFYALGESKKGYDPPYRAGSPRSHLWRDQNAHKRDPVTGNAARNRLPNLRGRMPAGRIEMAIQVELR